MTYTRTGHPVLDEMLTLVEATADHDSNDGEISALQSALSVALELLPKQVTAAEQAFDEARTAYHLAAGRLMPTCVALLKERALKRWPSADKLVLLGAYAEDGELHLNVDEVWIGNDRLSEDDGNDDVPEFSDENSDVLMYLADVSGEDYLGTNEEDLT